MDNGTTIIGAAEDEVKHIGQMAHDLYIRKQGRLIICLLIFVALAITALIFTIVKVWKPQREEQYQSTIAARDSIIYQKEKTLKALQQITEEKDKELTLYKEKDSVLALVVVNNSRILQTLTEKDEQIKRRYGATAFTADSLQRAIANY